MGQTVVLVVVDQSQIPRQLLERVDQGILLPLHQMVVMAHLPLQAKVIMVEIVCMSPI
jgi:hypothetical protein